ncbi:MAG: hypothetical protein EXR35_02840 [Limnohabitans sp.]|nr:hypothetical protein [Limnohabitans sp.]
MKIDLSDLGLSLEHVDGVAQGTTFTALIKILATVLVAGIFFYGWRVCFIQDLDSIDVKSWTFILMVAVVIGLCLAYIFLSQTRIDDQTISQTWLWKKEIRIAEITQLKLIYIPYLTWLIAPRLVVRVGGAGLYVFHAADRVVLKKFFLLTLRGYSTE